MHRYQVTQHHVLAWLQVGSISGLNSILQFPQHPAPNSDFYKGHENHLLLDKCVMCER